MPSEAHARSLHAHVGDRIRLLLAFDVAQAKQCLYGDGQPTICAQVVPHTRLSVRVVGITRSAADVNSRETDHHDLGAQRQVLRSAPLRDRVDTGSHLSTAVPCLVGVVRRGGPETDPERCQAPTSICSTPARRSTRSTCSRPACGSSRWSPAWPARSPSVRRWYARCGRMTGNARSWPAWAEPGGPCSSDALLPVGLAAMVGIGMALIGAFFASELMPIGFARRVEPHRGRVPDWTVLVVGAVVCLALVIAATMAAVRSARRPVRSRSARALPAVLSSMSPSAAVGLRHVFARTWVTSGAGPLGVRRSRGGDRRDHRGPRLQRRARAPHRHTDPVWLELRRDRHPDCVFGSRRDPGVAAVANVHAGVPLRVKGSPGDRTRHRTDRR